MEPILSWGFGMTETCYGAIEKIGQKRRPNSSGQPRLHPDPGFVNQVRIVDDDGNPVPTGQPGEITINNPAVMPGYWRNQEQTDLALNDGWLHTGDLGWQDEDGFLYFVDRKKDVIRRRGENISSQEVEDVIKRHPTVLDCAVIAVPSELGEDEVKAYVTPRPPAVVDEETIVRWCAENLAYFKVPRYIEVREELPRTPSLAGAERPSAAGAGGLDIGLLRPGGGGNPHQVGPPAPGVLCPTSP